MQQRSYWWGVVVLLSLLSPAADAQFSRLKTPLTVTGYGAFKTGDTLLLGRGSGLQEYYQYIHQRQTFLNLEPTPLAGAYQGQRVVVETVHHWQGWRRKWPYLLVRINGAAYRIALVEALGSGEIRRPEP